MRMKNANLKRIRLERTSFSQGDVDKEIHSDQLENMLAYQVTHFMSAIAVSVTCLLVSEFFAPQNERPNRNNKKKQNKTKQKVNHSYNKNSLRDFRKLRMKREIQENEN